MAHQDITKNEQAGSAASGTHRLMLALVGAGTVISAVVFAEYNPLIIGVGLILLLAGAAPQALGPALPWILKLLQSRATKPKRGTAQNPSDTASPGDSKPDEAEDEGNDGRACGGKRLTGR